MAMQRNRPGGLSVIDAGTIRSLADLPAARRAVRRALTAVATGTALAADELAVRFSHGQPGRPSDSVICGLEVEDVAMASLVLQALEAS